MSHCIAMRECQTPVEVKNFQSQKNFQLFFKTGFVHVSGLCDNFKRKNFFSDFQSQTNLTRLRNEIPKAETPFTCNQRRRTLPVRITWKGEWTSGVSLHCDARVPDPSRGQKFSKSKKFSTFFQNGFCPCFRTLR